ncbi:Cro protein [Mycobacterium phage MissDaisy]|nr:Cro protein [Mycobacterium phage MissDaisy]
MPGPQTYELRWRPEAIAKLLRRNKITDRAELAEAIGISRATAYNLFNADWSGKVTTVVLAQLVGCLGANPSVIVETVKASRK